MKQPLPACSFNLAAPDLNQLPFAIASFVHAPEIEDTPPPGQSKEALVCMCVHFPRSVSFKPPMALCTLPAALSALPSALSFVSPVTFADCFLLGVPSTPLPASIVGSTGTQMKPLRRCCQVELIGGGDDLHPIALIA